MHFIPSSWLLNKMIERAEQAFEADREQAQLRREEQALDREVKALYRAAQAKSRIERWGY